MVQLAFSVRFVLVRETEKPLLTYYHKNDLYVGTADYTFCFQTFSEPPKTTCGLGGGVGRGVAPDHTKPQSSEGGNCNETRWQTQGSWPWGTVSRGLGAPVQKTPAGPHLGVSGSLRGRQR